jgi:FixJ family two-component response regulator
MRQKIAIVDDEPSVRRSLKRVVEGAGFPAQAYGSGEELLNDGLDEVACAILDINLGGMSGVETRRRLSSKYPEIPVIFITAMDSADIRKLARDLGSAAILLKPIRDNVLIDAVRVARLSAASPTTHSARRSGQGSSPTLEFEKDGHEL